MDNCKFTININGHYEEFNSEDELNSFLRQNKRAISSALTSDKVMFSLDRSKQQQVFQELGAKSSEIQFKEDTHQFFLGGTEYTPVTQLINKRTNAAGQDLVRSFDIRQWETKRREEMEAKTDADGKSVYTKPEIDEIIAKTKKSWSVSSLLGTSWHKVAEAYFKDRIENPQSIIELFPEMEKVPTFILEKYIKSLEDFRELIKQKHPNSLFLTEAHIFDEDEKIAGIADLLVIDEKGDIHIYDYKTSLKSEAEWNANKQKTNKYQLGFYRQMLRRQGYTINSTSVIPVLIKEVDYANNVIYDFDIARPIAKTYTETEEIMQNIKDIMPFAFSNILQQVPENTVVHQIMKEGFNYEQQSTIRSTKEPEAEYEKMVAFSDKMYPDSKKYIYKSFNASGDQKVFSRSTPKEEIIEGIRKYLEELHTANTQLPSVITNTVKDVKEIITSGADINSYNWNGFSQYADSNDKLKKLIYKYVTDPYWEVVQSDSLTDINAISFENTQTNQVDFIILSGEDLEATPKFVGDGTSILGNFMKDNEAKQNGFTDKATNADVELLKIYAYIKNNKSAFVDKRIGDLYTLNILEGNRIPVIKSQSLSTLEKQYDLLIKQLPPQLNITNISWKPQEVDKAEAAVTYITNLLEDTSWINTTTGANKLKPFLNKYNGLSYNDDLEKVKLLDKMGTVLVKSITGDYNLFKGFERRDTALALKLVSEAVKQILDKPSTFESDLKRFGFSSDNMMLSSMSIISKNSVKQLSETVNNALNDVRTSFLHENHEHINPLFSKYYKAVGSVFKVQGLGLNIDLFEDLIQKDADGKQIMRFKDPSSIKSSAQKEFVQGFLRIVNDIRVKKMMEAGKSDDVIDEFLTSEEALNIPLINASALAAFKGKNFKQFTNDWFREIMNPNNIFKEDEKSLKAEQLQREMFNGFDLFDVNTAMRDEKIDKSHNGDFETDLEHVLMMYVMATVKQTEINKHLPLINAIKTLTILDEEFNFNPTPNTRELQTNLVATTIFGKTLLGGENPQMAKNAKVAQQVVSATALGFAPFSGATELITGFFANVSRLAANKYNQHAFGLKEYLKAHAIVAGTLFDNSFSYENTNFVESLNEVYGLSEMDIKRLVHEMKSTAKGLSNLKSKYLYWFNTFPGYFNRMVLFIASSIKDGIIDVDSTGHVTKNSAYQMIDGKLVYNEKLDKRFSLYTNSKDIAEGRQTEEWKKQKALYEAIKLGLTSEPHSFNSDGTFKRAYDNRQRGSIKNFADEVHGSYDVEEQTNFQKTAFGRMFMQFKGWLPAKKNRYFTTTHVNDVRGHYETELDANGEPKAVWKGKITEGIWQSMLATYDELLTNKGNVIKTWDKLNDTQKENFMFLLSDTFILGLLSAIVALLTESGMENSNPVGYKALKSLENSSHDFFIGYSFTAVGGTKNPIAVAATGTKIANDSWSVLTGGKAPSDLLKNIGVLRTISGILPTDK